MPGSELGGTEGALCLYCFGSGKGAVASLLKVPRLLALPEFQKSLSRGRGGKGAGGAEDGRRGCAITVLEGGQSANPVRHCELLPQAAARERLLTHLQTDPKAIPTFLSFLFKVQKALCCPRERIFGQAVECKEKGGS